MAEPGWYADTENPGQARWHDGEKWSEHRVNMADHTSPPPPPTVPEPPISTLPLPVLVDGPLRASELSAWQKFRARPRWAQITAWVVVAFVALIALGAAIGPKKTTAVAASTASTSATEAQSSTTSSAPSTTTTTQDPDEVTDPSAAGAAPPPAAATTSAASPTLCRTGDPLANVYHPTRLHVIRPCITVTGTVTAVRHEDDGDYHINLNLDPAYAGLINTRNTSGEHGALVVEIIPADEPGCTVGQPPKPPTGSYDYGTCTGANETAPPVGAHVSVTGPYVLDTAHGWMEIHPAWVIGTAPSPSPATQPPATTAHTPPAPTTTPVTAAPQASTTSVPPGGGATARCNDGTYSYAAHHQGACSHHGGVAEFYN